MIIQIKNNLNLKACMESICDRLNIGYGALSTCAIKDMAKHSESLLAVFPDNLKPGSAVHHFYGGAIITMFRRKEGWYISDIRINTTNEEKLVHRMTAPQKAFLNSFDEAVAA